MCQAACLLSMQSLRHFSRKSIPLSPTIFISYKLSFFIMVITSPKFWVLAKKIHARFLPMGRKAVLPPKFVCFLRKHTSPSTIILSCYNGQSRFWINSYPQKNSKALFTKVSNIHFHQPGLSRFFPLATNLFIVVFVIILNYFIKVKG